MRPQDHPQGVFAEEVAEREGFEPSVSCPTPHFECGALDHYATSPLTIMT